MGIVEPKFGAAATVDAKSIDAIASINARETREYGLWERNRIIAAPLTMEGPL